MIVINTISGFSASSRKNSDTLSGFIQEIVRRQQYMSDFPIPDIKLNSHFSTNPSCVEDSLSSLVEGTIPWNIINRVQFIGKSMGGVKTWWLLKKHWDEFRKFLEEEDNPKIGVTLIDPHGAQPGDGKIGSYGTFLQKELEYDKRWDKYPNFKIQCLYQRDKYPRGARLSGFSPNIKLNNSNHWDVTKLGTESGDIVSKSILEQIHWLSIDDKIRKHG